MSGKPLLVVVLIVLAGLVVVAAVASFSGGDGPAAGPGPAPSPAPPEAALPRVPLPLPPRAPRVEGEVGGRVLDPGGRPLAGAAVELSVAATGSDLLNEFKIALGGGEARASISHERGGARRVVAFATTAADGTFSFRTAEEGPFRVSATASGFARATEDDVARGRTDLALTLRAAGSVRGLVRDEAGAPVIAAVVSAAGEETLADETGAFTLAGLPAGESASISASAKGYDGASAQVAVVEGEVAVLGDPLVLTSKAGATGRVFDPRGEPLAGVRVTVGRGFDGFAMDSTDAGGRYLLEGLKSRDLVVTLKHKEFLAAKLEGFRYEKGTRLVLPDVRLQPGAAIEGRVVDEAGEPVAGAVTTVLRSSQGFDIDALILSGLGAADPPKSDADGRYRVAGLETGGYTLVVRAEGFRPLKRKDVQVRVPETTPIDVTLEQGLGVAGKVLDADGKPVAGANVTVSQDAKPTSFEDAFLQMGHGPAVSTGDDGAFVVAGLEEGKVSITVHAEGFADVYSHEAEAGQADVEIRLDRTGSVSGRVIDAETGAPVAKASVRVGGGSGMSGEDGTFTVTGCRPGDSELTASAEGYAPGVVPEVAVTAASETKGIEVRLPRGETLAGVVVRGADRTPVAGARIRVSGDVHRSAEAGDDGRFEIAGLPAGSYEVEASADGLVDGTVPVTVPASGEVRIALIRGGSIRGVVHDEQGRPVAGKMVMLASGGQIGGGGMARTDDQGRFLIENVKPGKVSLVLWEMGSGQGFSFDAQSTRVTVREGEEVFVEIGGGATAKKATLKARLLDHGKPVAGRMVMLFPVGGSGGPLLGGFKMATTDSEGGFVLKDLAPGRYAMISGDMGTRNMHVGSEIEIKEGGEIARDIELPAGALAGTVKGEGGAPVSGARVALIVPEKATTPARSIGDVLTLFKGQAEAGEDGGFVITNATPGRYLLLAGAPGYASTFVEGVVVAEQGTGPVDVALRRGSEVKVRVAGPEGAGVSGAAIFVTDHRGRWLLAGDELAHQTGSDGTVAIRLERGRYRLAVQSPDFAPAEREIHVADDMEVSVALAPGGAASLVVTAGGAVVEGAEVRLYRADGSEIVWRVTQESMMTGGAGTRTGADGALHLEHVPAGEVRFVATAPDGRRGEGAARIAPGVTAELAVEVE